MKYPKCRCTLKIVCVCVLRACVCALIWLNNQIYIPAFINALWKEYAIESNCRKLTNIKFVSVLSAHFNLEVVY